MAEGWLAALKGEIAGEAIEPLMIQTAATLDVFINTNPSALHYLLDILKRRLGDKIDGQTWPKVDASLEHYLGRDLAYFLLWMVQDENGDRVQLLERHGTPRVISFMRTVLGLYRQELHRAFMVWNELPDDWSMLHREVSYDLIAQRYLLQIRLEKFNGTEVVIEGSPDSLLNLTKGFIIALRAVDNPAVFGPDNVQSFLEECQSLIKMFAEPKETTAEGAQ